MLSDVELEENTRLTPVATLPIAREVNQPSVNIKANENTLLA